MGEDTRDETVVHVGGEPGTPGAYDVVIGRGIAGRVRDLVPESAARALLAHAAPVADLARRLADALADRGVEVHLEELPDAESAKTIEVATHLWGVLGRAGFTRTDVIVAVGGGAVTDLGGFVAATWLRGVPLVDVPTTLLGMVDAAVGGKTGINTAEGKNLVGAFHPPVGVLADLDVLATLPRADLAAGLAEVVKGGFIADPVILDRIESDPEAALDPTSDVLREIVERKIAVKARVVTEDLRESSLREILNYGHTFGHAIEQAESYRWRHGDAVAVGMVFVAELAVRTGHLDADTVARHRRVLASLGLPTRYDGASFEELLVVMGRDKKTRGATLRFVVLDGVGAPTRLVGPDVEDLRAAYEAVAGSAD
ncbi:3-dehydroquinate synthase [Mobilicoccus pelagius]|uniref:3-dehydroquinate synthase n=1 Tax=Mobilicoccus pelagius NBRC 104925 TaxID=1089455 RepID=H5UV39_9MICO|nr:3-dehydroquinate synthase [Mobilicoccus pelagius]GAB49597.1 3-dehydroquinate synthase [Mobilicoccus pelagius NBRC 104925]